MTTSATASVELPLTGERTVPGIPRENYWFRRHEAAYRWVIERFADELCGASILDAGCGEGYGLAALAQAAGVPSIGLELDARCAAHAHSTYSANTQIVAANLNAFPLEDGCIDALVSMQVIEHLWDLNGFFAECLRVLKPGGLCVFSTPNRLTFSPGLRRGDQPTNPFHVEEFDSEQLRQITTRAGFHNPEVWGLRHRGALLDWERANTDIVAAQVAAVLSAEPDAHWSTGLLDAVTTVTCSNFAIDRSAIDHPVADCADLIVVARRPLAHES